MARLAICVFVAALTAASLRAGPSPPPRQGAAPPGATPFDQIFLAYRGGDYGVVARTIRTPQQFFDLRSSLFTAAGGWRRDWAPAGPVFLLEVASLGLEYDWFDPRDIIRTARDLVMARPTAIGERADLDTFELTFHRSAIAMLLVLSMSEEAQEYLRVIESRVVSAPGPTRRLVEPRLEFERALIKEVSARGGVSATLAARRVEEAITAYEIAARQPATRSEALVRRAWLQIQAGRPVQALLSLDDIPAEIADPDVRYWSLLVRGRASEAADQTEAAVRAYEAAAAMHPQAQSPAAALAVALLRLGRSDESNRFAQLARTAPITTIDPWWRFRNSELRSLPGWFDSLRAAAR